MLNIKCIICKKKIKNPRVDQLCCDNDKCKNEFNYNMIELWKLKNLDKVKAMNKKSYSTRKNKTERFIKEENIE